MMGESVIRLQPMWRFTMPKILIAVLIMAQIAAARPTPAVAQSTPTVVELSGSELHQFRTEDGTLYELYIAFPLRYEPDEDAEYSILYITDAGLGFALVAQTYRLMQLGEELPPMILVGIDKPTSSVTEGLASRVLDLTPTRGLETEQALTQRYEREVRSGGADAFLLVLTEEIIPWIEARYATSGERGLAGYSLGGLFATHVLLTSPTSFTRYLIGSPSLWWDNAVMFEREREYSREHGDLSARVYLSAGTDEGFGSPAMMLPNMLRLAETLAGRNYPGLELEYDIFQDETHLSGFPASMSRGLRFLFGGVD